MLRQEDHNFKVRLNNKIEWVQGQPWQFSEMLSQKWKKNKNISLYVCF